MTKKRVTFMLAVLAGAPVLLAGSKSKSEPVWAIRADHVMSETGSGNEGWLVFQGDRLLHVGVAERPAAATEIHLGGDTICAGWIDPITALGAEDDLSEPVRSLLPSVSAGDALSVEHGEFRRAARGGITHGRFVAGQRDFGQRQGLGGSHHGER